VAAGERLVDARLELALGPGADLARDALPILGTAEVALQAIDLPLALELRRHLGDDGQQPLGRELVDELLISREYA